MHLTIITASSFIIALRCVSSTPFYGDVSYFTFLNVYCSNHSITLIDNLRLSNEDSSALSLSNYETARYLQRINCLTRQYNNLSIFELKDKLPQIEYIQYQRKMQLLFDFTHYNVTFAALERILLSVSDLYEHCGHCLPFHLLFQSFSTEAVFEIAQKLLVSNSQLVNFQAILISNGRRPDSALHLRPIVNGCHRHPGLLWPQTKAHYQRLSQSARDCNLNGSLLRVSVNEYMPYCGFTRSSPTSGNSGQQQLTSRRSLDLLLLAFLAERFNFQYRFLDANKTWGNLVNGTWRGAVGHVLYGKSQLALCGISQTLARFRVVDYTRSHTSTSLAFLSRSPERRSKVWFFVSPFTLTVWLGLASCLLALGTLLWATSKPSSSLVSYLELLCLIALRQGSLPKLTQMDAHSGRLLLACWFLFTTLLFNLYSSSLYSFLAFPMYERPIDTIDDLVTAANADTHTILTYSKSTFLSTSITPDTEYYNSIFTSIRQHMRRHQVAMLDNPVGSLVMMERSSRRYIFILPRTILAYSRHLYKGTVKFHLGSENILSDSKGLVLPKRSPLLAPFNSIILQLREMAFIDFWMQSSGTPNLFSNPIDRSASEQSEAFALNDLQTLFYLLFLGCSAASLVVVLEMATFMCRKLLAKTDV